MAEGIENLTVVRFEHSGRGLLIEGKEKFNQEPVKLVD